MRMDESGGDKQQQLEQVYEKALKLEKSGHFAQAAVFYRQALALDAADCVGATVRLAAMGEGRAPNIAPPAYVATLFDQCAEMFDLILVDSLGYNVPNLLRDAVEEAYPGRKFHNMLDLGCGTGLVAEAFADCEMARTGLDLSENMVAQAHERGLYDNLYIADIIAFLRRAAGESVADGAAAAVAKSLSRQKWDLVIAADVLPYMGDLAEFFHLAGAITEQGGVFGFSSEDLAKTELAAAEANGAKNGQAADFAVGLHQRFAHSPAYIRAMLKQAGFKAVYESEITVRREQNMPVYGELILAEKL